MKIFFWAFVCFICVKDVVEVVYRRVGGGQCYGG